jgi:hypothetical protein
MGSGQRPEKGSTKRRPFSRSMARRSYVVRSPGGRAPGYYYVLFEDPDKIRIEICHVPEHGVLEKGASFAPGLDY